MKAAKKDIKLKMSNSDFEIRETQWGDMNVAWYTWHKKINTSPMLKGLPDDMCQTPHWGYILKGKMTINFKCDRVPILCVIGAIGRILPIQPKLSINS